MKIVRLPQSRYMHVHLEEIVRVESSVGDDTKKGTLIYLHGRSEPRYCDGTAKKVRAMIEEERSKEEIQLEALAIGLLLKAADKLADGRLHFAVSGDGLTVVAGIIRTGPLQGRDRSKCEHAEQQLSQYLLITVESKGIYRLNERGYQMAEFLVYNKHPEDQPFSGFVKLPARSADRPGQIGVQINQWNNTNGDVNNAISEHGNVVQNVMKITRGTSAKDRLFIDDIESFSKVRDVAPATVAPLLKDGYLDVAEDVVQKVLEEILALARHKKDWGGEVNDLYTANVLVDGVRTPTAFLLKGNGLKKKMMEIRDCGSNGDQVVRLFQSPADLFVIQFVGNIAEAVIHHAHGEIARLKTQGKEAHFLTLDGQDTARLLTAYGKLALPHLPLPPATLPPT
jgi:hypothetical protein